MINRCKEEDVPPKQACFAFLCCWLYRYGLFIFVCEGQLMKIVGFIFRGDSEKNHEKKKLTLEF